MRRLSLQPLKLADRRRLGLLALLAAFSITASLIVTDSVFPHAALASTNSLVTASSYQSLALAADSQAYSSGSSTAVVTLDSSDGLIAQAASLASGLNASLVLSSSGSNATMAISDLHTRGASHVTLVGYATSFSSGFVSAVSAQFTIDKNIAMTNEFARSKLIAQALPKKHLVVANKTNPADVRIAANYAAVNGYPLIYIDGTEAATDLTSFLSSYSNYPVTLVGDAHSLSGNVTADQTNQLDVIDTIDPASIEVGLANRVVAQGNTATDIYTAPSDQLGSISIAALIAHALNAVAIPAGPTATPDAPSSFKTYAALWASEVSKVHFVGKNLTPANLTATTAPTTVQRSALPVWRITDSSVTSSSWVVSFTPYSGANSYQAYDLFGTLLGSSASTSISMVGTPQAIAIVANDAAGSEITRLDFRVNKYDVAADRETSVIADTKSGTNFLQFLGVLKSPRLVTRTMTDPLVTTPNPPTISVAITCLGYYVDAGLDPTKQYAYEVQTIGGADNRACNQLASQAPSTFTNLISSSVSLPLTVYPSSPATLSLTAAKVVQKARAASPTTVDSVLMNVSKRSTLKSRVLTSAVSSRTGSVTPQVEGGA